jgi:Spy/CpxP family protein refolding chaperone
LTVQEVLAVKKKQLFTLIAAVFFAGAAFGYFLNSYLMMRRFLHGPPQGGPAMADHMLDRLSRDLGLSKAQRGEIRPLMVDLHVELEKIRSAQEPVLKEVFNSAHDAIALKLTPEQKLKFDEIHQRMMKRFDGGPPGPPPPGPPPGMPPPF